MPARISVLAAWLDGWRRVFRAPVLVVGLLALLYLPAIGPHPAQAELTAVIGGTGGTETAERAVADAQRVSADSYGLGWILLYQNFSFGGADVAPFFAGIAMLLRVPIMPPLLPPPVIPLLLPSLLTMFLAGGTLDRLARGRPVRAQAFFAACGQHLFRFLRIGLILGLAYWMLFRWLYPWLVGPLFLRIAGANGDRAMVRVAIDVVFATIFMAISLVGDFAMVRTVVEDRRSAIGSVAAALRFLRRRPLRVIALYALNSVLLYTILFNGPRVMGFRPDLVMVSVLVLSAIATVTKLAIMASATAFFQGELAHAQYTASPAPVWPESPAAEAIRNLTAGGTRR